jgi:hypothetical protein
MLVLTATAVSGFVALPLPAQTTPKVSVAENYGKLPLSFEVNTGQADKAVKFLSRSEDYGLYLTGNQAVVTLRKTVSGAARHSSLRKPRPIAESAPSDVVRMQLAGASGKTEPMGEERLPGTANYYIGNDPAKWHTSISTYAKVRYTDIYPGIDLVYYGNQRQLEYDFVVAPAADPQLIRLRLNGANQLHLPANGNLVVTAAHGTLIFHKPLVYQMVDGQRHPVSGDFKLVTQHTVGFRLGHYDHARPLVIDPVLMYSTYLGGSGTDAAQAIAVDAAGNVYVAGQTSTDFPVTPGAFQTTDNGAAANPANAFITKLNPTGTALVYSTYLGGSGTQNGTDSATGIAVDSSGNAYVTGNAYSTNFPVTSGAFQTTNKAAANNDATAFITKLNPTGTALVYSTYLGGSGAAAESGDSGKAIAVDADGDAYITGQTYSADFPVTQGSFQTANNAAAGFPNAFVTKLNPAGTALVYSTYLGGTVTSNHEGPLDSGNAIAVNSAGNAYIAGQTPSTSFPVTPGAFQATNNAAAGFANAFVTELNPAGTALVYSTYLGGSSSDTASAVAVDSSGNAYVAGSATSTNFPVTPGAFQSTNNGNLSGAQVSNAFVTKLNPTGTALIYSTYLGGSGGTVNLTPILPIAAGDQASGVAVDSSGDAYITGSTASSNVPITPGAYQTTNNDQTAESLGGNNAFVSELNPAGSALVYSTYLGGNGIDPDNEFGVADFGEGDQASALALDSSGNVYVTGSVTSGDFPVTSGSFQTTISSRGSAFVSKLTLSATSTATTPTVTVTPAPTSIASAQPLTVTISVNGNPAPTGTVTLASGTYSSDATTLTDGSATIHIPAGALVVEPAQAPSPDVLTANYVPDATSSSTYNFSSGLSSVYVIAPDISVTPSATTLTLTQAQSQPLSVSIVATSINGLPTPSGTVILTAGSYVSAPATLTGGQATITIPAGTLPAGYNQLVADYSGDSNYLAYGGSSLVTVTPIGNDLIFWIDTTPITIAAGTSTGNTSTVLILPQSNELTGTVALTCTVVATPPNPTSPVACSIPSSVNITGAVNTMLTVTSTAATTVGDYAVAITGTLGSVTEKAIVDVTVTAAPPQPGFALTNSGNITLSPGATTSNTSTISTTGSNGFSGVVSLSCAVSPTAASDPAMCSLSPTSVTISGATAQTSTLTITTTAATSTALSHLAHPKAGGVSVPWYASGGATLACVMLFGIPARRRRWRTMLGMLILLAFLTGGLSSCGGGSSSGGGSGNSGTTAGTYTVTVTGVSGSTTETTAVTLTVN